MLLIVYPAPQIHLPRLLLSYKLLNDIHMQPLSQILHMYHSEFHMSL